MDKWRVSVLKKIKKRLITFLLMKLQDKTYIFEKAMKNWYNIMGHMLILVKSKNNYC